MDVWWLAHQISHAGLTDDWKLLVGSSEIVNTEEHGIDWLPHQLARMLIKLSEYSIESMVHVSTRGGWTVSAITAYLHRFNPGLKAVTVDVEPRFSFYAVVADKIPLTYRTRSDNCDIDRERGTLAILDTTDTYDIANHYYEEIGAEAPLCVVHNMNDAVSCHDRVNEGGIPRLWREILKKEYASNTIYASEVYEYLDHPIGAFLKGVGLIARDGAKRRVDPSLISRVWSRRSQTLRCLRRMDGAFPSVAISG
jgi:hypothetical protein